MFWMFWKGPILLMASRNPGWKTTTGWMVVKPCEIVGRTTFTSTGEFTGFLKYQQYHAAVLP